jgi:hypothetical protein
MTSSCFCFCLSANSSAFVFCRSLHGLINYIDTKAKCRHLKKFTCGRCLSVFIDRRRYSQSCWNFRPSFVNCCPSNLLSGSTLPHPFSVSKYPINIQCVAGRGVWSPVGDHILQEFNTLYLTRFRTFKIARPLQTKTYEGRGPYTDNTCRKDPSILDDDILLWCLYS